jgi:hypothetical protein
MSYGICFWAIPLAQIEGVLFQLKEEIALLHTSISLISTKRQIV